MTPYQQLINQVILLQHHALKIRSQFSRQEYVPTVVREYPKALLEALPLHLATHITQEQIDKARAVTTMALINPWTQLTHQEVDLTAFCQGIKDIDAQLASLETPAIAA